jgi:hypothetical protein
MRGAVPQGSFIASFDDLLRAARQQPRPQRLLFVFAAAGVSADSTPEQRARFAANAGGELTPLMCVDKAPEELSDFAALVEESAQFGNDWAIVFVAALDGRDGLAPTSVEAEAPLQRMVEAIKTGSVGSFLPFDRSGRPLQLG